MQLGLESNILNISARPIPLSCISSFVELCRPLNGLIAFLSVWSGAYITDGLLLTSDQSWWQWFDVNRSVWLVAVAAFLALSAGNSLNDFCDVRIDRINKPKRPIPSGRVSRRQALIFSLILLGSSVQLGYRVNQTAFLIVVGVVSTLVAYAFWLKRTPLIGNLVVGGLTALTFIAGGVAKGITREVFPLAIFAFLFTTAREIVKDLEDLPGDRAQSVATLPLLWGERRAISIALLLIGGGIIFSPIPYLLNWYSWIYLVLMIFGVDLVLVYLGFQLWTNPTQRNCARIQKWMKWNIFVGLLAVCLGVTI